MVSMYDVQCILTEYCVMSPFQSICGGSIHSSTTERDETFLTARFCGGLEGTKSNNILFVREKAVCLERDEVVTCVYAYHPVSF